MAEDVGSVYSEVRLKLDNLDHDILEVGKKLERLGKNMDKNVDKPNKAGKKSFFDLKGSIASAIPAVGGLMAAYKALSAAIQGAIQFAKESIAAYQAQEVATARLGAVLESTGASAWTTQKQLTDLAKAQSKSTGNTVEDIQKMQSVLLGFTSITGNTFNRATEGLINMSAVMGGDLASAANQFGKALDNPAESLGTLSRYGFKFTEEQKAMVKELEAGGKHAQAQALILESMEKAFGNAASAVNKAVKSQSDYNNAVSSLKKASGEGFERAITPMRNFFTTIIEQAAAAIKGSNDLRDSLEYLKKLNAEEIVIVDTAGEAERVDHLLNVIKNQILKADADIQNKKLQHETGGVFYSKAAREKDETNLAQLNVRLKQLEKIGKDIHIKLDTEQAIEEAVGAVKEGNAAAIFALQEQEKKRAEELKKISEDYRNELAKIGIEAEKNLITEEQANEKRAAANAKQVQSIIALKSAHSKEFDEYKKIAEQIEIIQGQINEAGGDDKDNTLTKQIEKLKALEEEYDNFFVQINKSLTGDIDTGVVKQLNDERIAAEKELSNLVDDYRDKIADVRTSEEYVLRLEQNRALAALEMSEEYRKASDEKKKEAEAIIEEYYAIRRVEEANKEINDISKDYSNKITEINQEMERQAILHDSTLSKKEQQLAIVEKEVEWAIEGIQATQAWKDADIAAKDAMIAKIHEWGKEQKAAAEEGAKEYQNLGEYMKANGQQLISQSVALFNTLAEMSTEAVKREVEKQTKLLQQQYDFTKDLLDKEMQEKLYRLGVVGAATEAQYDNDLQRAIESGDHKVTYEAEIALEKHRIEEEYAKKQEILEKMMAMQKAQLQYKAEMAVWKMKLMSTIASAAQAVISAAIGPPSFPWSIPFIAMATGLGSAQIAAVMQAKPVMQYFATGGIVPGTSYSGDKVPAMLNSKEMVMNQQDQKDLWDFISKGSQGGGGTIEIVVMLNSDVLTKAVVKDVNNGKYFIKARGIA